LPAFPYRIARTAIAERGAVEELSRGQLTVLTSTLAALAQQPELETFLGLILKCIAEQLATHSAGLWLRDEDGSGRMFIDYDNGKLKPGPMSEHPGALQPAVKNFLQVSGARLVAGGMAYLVDDIYARQELEPLWGYFRQRHIKGLLMVPLKFGETQIGSISIRIVEDRPFSEAELELAVALTQQAALAIQLRRLADSAQRAAVAQERNRLAREIHDTLAQGFTGVILHLEAAEAALTVRPRETSAAIERAKLLARQSLAEARRSVMALRPAALDGVDLSQALPRLIDGAALGPEVRVAFSVVGEKHALDPNAEANLLRIAQEAVNNARKHAAASELQVTLAYDRGSVCLSVADNGRGFDPHSVNVGAGGFGFVSMQERADAMSAQLAVVSSPGTGTRVTVTLGEKAVT